jgi:predicted Zn-ribbon and HTH transcriptional regulator
MINDFNCPACGHNFIDEVEINDMVRCPNCRKQLIILDETFEDETGEEFTAMVAVVRDME